MFLLLCVINKESIIDDLITGWIDVGITDSTVIETTDAIQLISHHVPIFAGFRILTSGGMKHNKTIFTVIEKKKNLDQAIEFLEALCAEENDAGSYVVIPIKQSGKLGKTKDIFNGPD